MVFLLLASLFLSDAALVVWTATFYRRRHEVRDVALWGLGAAGCLTFSALAYTLYALLGPGTGKVVAFRLALLSLNTAAVLSAYFLLALVGRAPRARLLWGLPYLGLLWVAHAPLFTQPLTLQSVTWGGRTWWVFPADAWPPGGILRAALIWATLLSLLLLAIWARWQGLPQRRWTHIGVFVIALLWPYLLWMANFFVLHWPLNPAWVGLWGLVLLWSWGLYRLGMETLPALQMETLLHYAGAGVMLFSWPQARLLWWNRQIEEWFGRGPDGRPNLPDFLERRLHRLLQEPQVQEVYAEETLFRRFEVRCVEVGDGKHLQARALVMYDITEPHRVQQMLLQQHTMESRRRRLLEMALNTATWKELAYRMVRYLGRPWPEFTPLGCALYLCARTPGEDGSSASVAHLVWGVPESLPWRAVWEDVPQATLIPLSRAAVLPADELADEAQAVGIVPLVPPGETQPLGYMAFLLSQDQIEAWDRWVNVRKDLGRLVAFLLRFAQDREHQVLLEKVFHRTTTAVLILDRQGRPLLWNRALLDVLKEQGVPPEGLSRSLDRPFLDWWWRTALWDQVLWNVEREGSWHRVLPQPGGGEDARYWWLAAFPIYDAQGAVQEVGCVVYDFTHLEQARRELEAQQGFLERLLNSARALWATLPSLNQLLSETLRLLRQWYPEASVSLLLLEQDAVGRLYATMWMRETGWQAVPPFFHRVLQEGAMGWALRHQESLLIPDVREDARWHPQDLPGVQVGSALVAPMFYRQRPLGILVLGHERPHAFRDVDARLVGSLAQWLALALYNARLYEDQLRLQRLYRREQERVEAQRQRQVQLLDDLSHAVRTPLTALLEHLEPLANAGPEEQDALPSWTALYRLTQDMLEVLETYLDHRRLEQQPPPSTLVPVPVQGIFQEVADILEPLVERYQVTLALEVHPPDLTITQERGRLRRVLQSLAEFSIRRAQGGQVVLRAFYDPESRPPGVVFWVMDTGPEVDLTDVEGLFQDGAGQGPLATLPLAFQTRQINLMLVREHVEKMGGRLRVRQVSGFGLAFWLWLPKAVLRRKTARPS